MVRTPWIIEEAVDHFIVGNYYVEAVGLIEKLLPTMVQANWAVLHRWIAVLPEACISEKPMIEIYYISVLIGFGEWELAKMRAEQVGIRLAGMKHTLTDEDWGKAIGNLYWGYAMIAYTQRDLQRAIDCLDIIEQHMPEGSYLQTLGGNAAVGSKYDDMIAHINDLHLAESFIKRWVKTWENKKNYRFGGYFYVAYSELLYEWNLLEEAELYAERVLQQKDMQQLSRNLVRAVAVASRIQYITGCPDMAHEMLEQVKSKINSPDYLIFSMRIEALKANLWIRQGSNDDLAHWLQTCGFSYKDDIPLYHVGEYMTLARTLAHCGHLVECEYLLERLHRLVSREDRLRDRIRVLIGQCIMLYLGGREQIALIKLEEALYLAEPHGYIRSFIDEGESMANMLTRYLNLRQLKHIRSSFPVSLAYVGKLLLLMNVSVKGNVTSTSLLTEQETKIFAPD
ncbi:hypothetical protein PP175_23740 [Aneurinibacillus sp. Ricciae_BoGa-3]|uniref:hypothetical protein n=1 Tax=Aneurinibacillus sp. Ricciae_BoGa-3 TaxID=3022697 RepID=UPI00234058F5|nr:hypothetical protein [Aneurinibacillus sp. Ricciae_BoGa-3]WCK54264.1 hypothetical protein PP175_23740 [Aneurinibacillus sp. Ricciae_BoGa-3]